MIVVVTFLGIHCYSIKPDIRVRHNISIPLHLIWKTLVTLVIITGMCLHGQVESNPFRNFALDLRVSHGNVYSIYQDQKGLIWLGTDNGLNYFDGFQFKIWEAEHFSGLRVRKILPDGNGGMWLGTDQGIIRINAKRQPVFWKKRLPGLEADEAAQFVLSMALNSREELLVGTRKGLCLYEEEKGDFRQVDYIPPELIKTGMARIHGIETDGENLWLGTGLGLIYLNTKTGATTQYKHEPGNANSLSNNEIRALKRDAKGHLWIGTISGLSVLNPREGSFSQPVKQNPEMPQKLWVNTMDMDGSGSLWIGTRTSGIWVLEPSHKLVQRYNQEPSFGSVISNNILEIAFIEPGLLWVGTFKNGACMLDLKPKRFKSYLLHKNERQVSDHVRCIYEDSQENLWIGNRNGLIRYEPDINKISHFHHDPTDPYSLASDNIISLGGDDSGRIWVGSFNSGANVYDPKTDGFIHYKHDPEDPNSLGYDYVQAIEPYKDGKVWVGTWRGLYLFDPETEIFSEREIILKDNLKPWIYDIHTIKNGEIWVASGNGLLRGDKNGRNWKVYTNEENEPRIISDNQPTSILEDSLGRIWVGSFQGLNLWIPEEDRFRVFAEKDGLPSASVRAMVEGDNGEIWLGTTSGLARFRLDEGIRVFNQNDGLRSREFYLGSALKNERTGTIYFGGPKGYNSFIPSKMVENVSVPPVMITSISIFNQTYPFWEKLDEENRVTLTPQQNFFTLQFSVLDLTSPSRNQYAYMLEGYDKKWITPQKGPYAAYSNLKAGAYRFRVKGSNNDGVWNESGDSFTVRVLPHFWEYSLFIVLILLFLSGSIVAAHHYLIKGARKRSDELNEEADQRGEALQDLHQQLLEEARKAGIAEITTGVLHNIGNILNSISTSAHAMIGILNQSKLEKLSKGNLLLMDLPSAKIFFKEDPKGIMLPPYYRKVVEALGEEHEKFRYETKHMLNNVDLMKRAVTLEQHYDQEPDDTSEISLESMVEDALKLQEISLKKREIRVERSFSPTPPCNTDSFKLIHVLINLIRNAVDALVLGPANKERVLKVTVRPFDDHFNEIQIRDNGCGIDLDKLPEIFSYGFTTKETGNGFGLHTCKLAMEEIGGVITAGSRGMNKGAVFILKVPVNQKEDSP